MMAQVDRTLIPYVAGEYLLTDDKAPVELLSMRAIDSIISDELVYYKGIYRERGLKGIMEMLGV